MSDFFRPLAPSCTSKERSNHISGVNSLKVMHCPGSSAVNCTRMFACVKRTKESNSCHSWDRHKRVLSAFSTLLHIERKIKPYPRGAFVNLSRALLIWPESWFREVPHQKKICLYIPNHYINLILICTINLFSNIYNWVALLALELRSQACDCRLQSRKILLRVRIFALRTIKRKRNGTHFWLYPCVKASLGITRQSWAQCPNTSFIFALGFKKSSEWKVRPYYCRLAQN